MHVCCLCGILIFREMTEREKGWSQKDFEDWQFESNVTYAWEGFDAKKMELWNGRSPANTIIWCKFS